MGSAGLALHSSKQETNSGGNSERSLEYLWKELLYKVIIFQCFHIYLSLLWDWKIQVHVLKLL